MSDRRIVVKPKHNKWYRQPLALPGINYKGNFMVGFEWPYTNSKGDVHITTMTDKGWRCTCMGFTHHGKCKHITQLHERITCDDDIPLYRNAG